MATDTSGRTAELIGLLRRRLGDEYAEESSTKITATQYLSADGDGYTAQQLADALVTAVNKFLRLLYDQVDRDGERMARLVPEMVTDEELTLVSFSVWDKFDKPDDYFCFVSGRFRRGDDPNAIHVVDEVKSYRGVEHLLTDKNQLRHGMAKMWVQGSNIFVMYNDVPGEASPTATNDILKIRYIRRQKQVTAGSGPEEILLENSWDEQILELARQALYAFQQQ